MAIYTGTTVGFDNSSSKGLGSLATAIETITTGTVNIATSDQFVFTFAAVPGLKLRAILPFVNGTGSISATMGTCVFTTSTLTIQGQQNVVVGYTAIVNVGTVTGTGIGTVGCIAYYG
jgi:hypothetical protein